MLIKLLLLGAIAGALVVFVRSEHTLRIQAGKRLAFFAFILLNAFAVIFPDTISKFANLLGVGRGADLVLYALVVAFTFVTLSLYLKIRQSDRRITELARTITVLEGEATNRKSGKLAVGDYQPVTDDEPTRLGERFR